MPQYLIERHIPGAGNTSYEDLVKISKRSNEVLAELGSEGTQVEWKQSYVAGDKIYCVYSAPNEEAVREHAKRGPFPANLIVPISEVISPATGK